MIRISNIYHMLAYAFHSLNNGCIADLGNEEFENLHELFAEIIIRCMLKQLKRGLPKKYESISEELRILRGRIDIPASIRGMTQTRRHLVCGFDDFTDDIPSNQLIKCAITYLLHQDDVSREHKRYLKYLRFSLNSVSDVSYSKRPIQKSGGAEYVMLVSICRFLLDGLLLNEGGGYSMRKWLSDERMSVLYERFLLEYFKRHYPTFNARSMKIRWDMHDIPDNMPEMKCDVCITNGDKTLIIDAKYYTKHTMVEHFTKKTYHSHNLYQIYTYVKNTDLARSGNISGMLLYAKTDEDVTPDIECIIGGNRISVKTLDLSQSFAGIQAQLDKVAYSIS